MCLTPVCVFWPTLPLHCLQRRETKLNKALLTLTLHVATYTAKDGMQIVLCFRAFKNKLYKREIEDEQASALSCQPIQWHQHAQFSFAGQFGGKELCVDKTNTGSASALCHLVCWCLESCAVEYSSPTHTSCRSTYFIMQ